jgi:hypothetical protein
MRHATIFGAGLIAACLGFGFAQAQDKPDKADYTLHTKLLDASVTVDGALKKFPGLYDNLLAEGKRQAAKWDAQAKKDKKEYPDLFRDGRPQEYDRGYSERSVVAGRFVSVVRSDYMDTGGAHPNHVSDTILWDAKAKERISIRPFFKETATNGPTLRKLAHDIRAALAVEKKARDVPVDDPDKDQWLSSVKPNLLKIGGAALAPSTEAGKSSGLLFFFSPYAVGAYVEGSYVAFVPWTAFKAALSHEGAAIFGGERPKGDAEKDENG